jgi:hypothetical protein
VTAYRAVPARRGFNREQQAALFEIETALQRVTASAALSVTPATSADVRARAGDHVRVAPRAGITPLVLLPSASLAGPAAIVYVTLERAGSFNVASSDSLVNGVASVTYSIPGLYLLKSDGAYSWWVSGFGSDTYGADLTALLNVFTSTLKGLVPASGGGTLNYLRADGSFATPPDTNTTYSAGDTTIVLTGTAFTRAAVSGDITIAAGSNTAAIGAGVIVDNDVNAAAAIALTKTGAMTGEVTKASGAASSAITRSTNFAWTGEHVHAERAAAPTVAAGQGGFWPRNLAPSAPMFTDDVAADWAMGYACVAVNTTTPTATNATTNLSCGGSYSVPANTPRAGTLYRFNAVAVYDHAAAATPTITVELLINAAVVTTLVITPMAVARAFDLHVTGYIRFQTVGAGGTAMCTLEQVNSFAVQGAGSSSHDHVIGDRGTATTAVNTTVARSIELRMRMTTAVASNTLTVTQGFIERLS